MCPRGCLGWVFFSSRVILQRQCWRVQGLPRSHSAFWTLTKEFNAGPPLAHTHQADRGTAQTKLGAVTSYLHWAPALCTCLSPTTTCASSPMKRLLPPWSQWKAGTPDLHAGSFIFHTVLHFAEWLGDAFCESRQKAEMSLKQQKWPRD